MLTLLDDYEVGYGRFLIEEDLADCDAMAWPLYQSLFDGQSHSEQFLCESFQEHREDEDFSDALALHVLQNTEGQRPLNTVMVVHKDRTGGRFAPLVHPDTNEGIFRPFTYAAVAEHGDLKSWVDSYQYTLPFPLIYTPTKSGEMFWLHQDCVFRGPADLEPEEVLLPMPPPRWRPCSTSSPPGWPVPR
jgi:hypothetical protein